MKNTNFKQHFATTYRCLTKKIMAFVYLSTFLVHFTMLAPNLNFVKGKTINILRKHDIKRQ